MAFPCRLVRCADLLHAAGGGHGVRWRLPRRGQLNDTSLRCDPTILLDPLMVTEGHAQLGRINGWVTGSVRPNGQLHMMNSQGVIVTGQFQGDQFRGTAWKPLVSPCIYRVEMNRVS